MFDKEQLTPSVNSSSTIIGDLAGGNLTLVENSIGTCWQIQTTKKIIFLEEINEQGYRVDRSLNHIRQAGLLVDVAAIVLGDFTHEKEGRLNIDYALARFAQEITIPIYQSKQFGHGFRNHPLIYNSPATISRANNITYNLTMAL
jgi:muramoyltetrapeptide carboxypeptidase